MSADQAPTRAARRRLNRHGVRQRPDGRVQCHRHGKALYASQDEAARALMRVTDEGGHITGLHVYACDAADGWHLGHRAGRYRTLALLIEEKNHGH